MILAHDISMPNDPPDEEMIGPVIAEKHRRDTLDYITRMADELSALAREARLDLVAYLLDMASLEAGSTRRKIVAPETRVSSPG